MTQETKTFTLVIKTNKEIPNLTDVIANRLWSLDGVTDVTCAVAQAPEPVTKEESFDAKIAAFNRMYGLPCLEAPDIVQTPDELDQYLEKIYSIFKEELDEVDVIRQKLREGASRIEILTELADWLGDLQVYCASEMVKFGLPPSLILSIIMASNMSKLGLDGKPIYDERGKVMKGPNYWKPEPQIQRALIALQRQYARSQDM
jgi:hypothetical protein